MAATDVWVRPPQSLATRACQGADREGWSSDQWSRLSVFALPRFERRIRTTVPSSTVSGLAATVPLRTFVTNSVAVVPPSDATRHQLSLGARSKTSGSVDDAHIRSFHRDRG